MSLDTPPFVHDFCPGVIHYGRNCITDLSTELDRRDLENVLVVCGSNVGANRDVVEPLESVIDDRLAGIFDETTPEKRIETAYDGVERMREGGVDALVPVGGGSSLDLATAMSVLHADYRSLEAVQAEVAETGTIAVPETPSALTPRFPVPTTLAGADLSIVAGVMIPMDGTRVGVGIRSDALMPEAMFYDPDLFETTPLSVLCGSAMNGFDKGVEAIYSRHASPLSDASAVRGLQYLRAELPRIDRASADPAIMERIVTGVILVQYGTLSKSSLIHAFGHSLRRRFGVQQGIAHAIMAPHVLRYIFGRIDGRRDLLADALVRGPDPDDPADRAVEAVVDVRDALDLPSRLRTVDGTSRDDLRRVAELTLDDSLVANLPPELDPTVDDFESVLEDAW